jgi:adenylate cyclase
LKQLESERKKSEQLLLNVLPKPIAERLKGGETVIADNFAEVSILFADLVGFTSLSNHVSPVEVVNLLNEIFTAFDNLAARLGLEKIKTIGDAYMVAAGLPVARDDHAEAIAQMALDIQAETARFNATYNTSIQIRIGVNLGPAIAGIIGKQKFIYDLWGDTVNLASRMESLAAPGTILVTADVHRKLQDKFHFQDARALDVKGRGVVETWLLAGRKPPA